MSLTAIGAEMIDSLRFHSSNPPKSLCGGHLTSLPLIDELPAKDAMLRRIDSDDCTDGGVGRECRGGVAAGEADR